MIIYVNFLLKHSPSISLSWHRNVCQGFIHFFFSSELLWFLYWCLAHPLCSFPRKNHILQYLFGVGHWAPSLFVTYRAIISTLKTSSFSQNYPPSTYIHKFNQVFYWFSTGQKKSPFVCSTPVNKLVMFSLTIVICSKNIYLFL